MKYPKKQKWLFRGDKSKSQKTITIFHIFMSELTQESLPSPLTPLNSMDVLIKVKENT